MNETIQQLSVYKVMAETEQEQTLYWSSKGKGRRCWNYRPGAFISVVSQILGLVICELLKKIEWLHLEHGMSASIYAFS